MAKGKNKPNAFFYFMLDWKSKQERKGVKFPNGIKDVQIDPECNEEWRNLPDHDKLYFKELAKNGSGQQKMKKRTGNGELLEDLRSAEQRAKEFKDNMIEYITDLVKRANARNALSDIKFYVIHINYFYFRQLENNQLEYYPAEIALGEFTIKNGAKRMYHCIVNETPRIGFTQTSKEQSEKSHQIPIEPPFGKTDYSEIFHEICKFLEPDSKGRYPPIYTVNQLEDNNDCVKSVLSRLAIAGQESDQFFTVYSFEDLLTIMHNTIASPDATPLEPLAALIEIKKDTNAYKPGLCCKYHESVQVGTLFCSQALIQRWYFTLCAFCCEPLGVEIIPGIQTAKARPILTESLAKLTIGGKSRRGNSTMSEISYDSKKCTSEKLYADEQRRKVEASMKPFSIIDRSLFSKLPPVPKLDEPIFERPLRPPHTRSAGLNFDSTDTESIDFSECSFPSIGRGAIKKKPAQKSNSGAGHGYADVVKH